MERWKDEERIEEGDEKGRIKKRGSWSSSSLSPISCCVHCFVYLLVLLREG